MPRKPKSNYSAETQPEKDLWETPAVAYELIRWWLGNNKIIWESAPGTERFSRCISGVSSHSIIVGDDNYPDFFQAGRRLYQDFTDVVQITNPPYSRKYEWLARSYELGIPFALLLPTDTLAAGKGMKLFAKYGVAVVIPEHRLGFVNPETGQVQPNSNISTAWFIWPGNNEALQERLAFRFRRSTLATITLPRVRENRKLRQLNDSEYIAYAAKTPALLPQPF